MQILDNVWVSFLLVMLGCCKLWKRTSPETGGSGAASLSITLMVIKFKHVEMKVKHAVKYWSKSWRKLTVSFSFQQWTKNYLNFWVRIYWVKAKPVILPTVFTQVILPDWHLACEKTNMHTLNYNSSTQMRKYTSVSALFNAAYQQVVPFGKRSWHKHRRINTETDVGSQSRSPLRRKGCK